MQPVVGVQNDRWDLDVFGHDKAGHVGVERHADHAHGLEVRVVEHHVVRKAAHLPVQGEVPRELLNGDALAHPGGVGVGAQPGGAAALVPGHALLQVRSIRIVCGIITIIIIIIIISSSSSSSCSSSSSSIY